MRLVSLSLSVALCAGTASATPRTDAAGEFAALQALEARVAAVAWRLTSANTELCPSKGPQTGLTLHDARQYAPDARADAVRFFHLIDAPAIMAVAPGSPAESAGLRAGDAITAVAAFADDVRSGRYPSEAETYHFADGTPVPGLYQAADA